MQNNIINIILKLLILPSHNDFQHKKEIIHIFFNSIINTMAK